MNAYAPWHVSVLIPARNEEELLPRCLRSVLLAKRHLARSITVDIVVVADSSTDRTVQIATDILGADGVACSINAGVVGTVRQVAACVALKRSPNPPHRCWLANTDADCIVPPAWLSNQLAIANTGIEAVAGTVSVDSFEQHGPEVQSRFKSTYLIESNGTHPHVHGANLGVRADSYVQAGGWRHLETAEDHDLWARLSRISARKLSTNRIEVQTSGRLVGRAPHGFAAALAAHNETAA